MQLFNIFLAYTPFKIIIKYCLYSLCCTISPCRLFILYLVVCTMFKSLVQFELIFVQGVRQRSSFLLQDFLFLSCKKSPPYPPIKSRLKIFFQKKSPPTSSFVVGKGRKFPSSVSPAPCPSPVFLGELLLQQWGGTCWPFSDRQHHEAG